MIRGAAIGGPACGFATWFGAGLEVADRERVEDGRALRVSDEPAVGVLGVAAEVERLAARVVEPHVLQ